METHPEPTLVEFIRYNTWANQLVLGACKDLDESQLMAKIPGAYGSVRDTFRHMLRAEADYINRITGVLLEPAFRWEDGPSLAEMSAFAAQCGEAFLDVIQRIPATQIVREAEEGLFIEYQARQLYMQVINHGIEHRTNITTLLSSHGLAVPEVDHWGYMFAHPDRFELKEGKVGNA